MFILSNKKRLYDCKHSLYVYIEINANHRTKKVVYIYITVTQLATSSSSLLEYAWVMKSKSPELNSHVWGIQFPHFQPQPIYIQLSYCSAWPWAWIPANYWWSLSSLSLGEIFWQESWLSDLPTITGEFLHNLNGMEQKLLEPPYKSQWQYKVLDLNTQKINDQVGIQHTYILRFLQLKKHIQSYAEHLVKSPLQVVGLKLMYQLCPSATKTECPKRSPAPLATGTRPRSCTWWAPQPRSAISGAIWIITGTTI